MQAVTHHGAPAPTIVLSPIRAAIPAQGGVLEVLVRVQAPPQPAAADGSAASGSQPGTAGATAAPQRRPPLRLALVVDRSGSMDGQPLDEALRCVRYIGGKLNAADQLAVVLYDDQARTPLPLGPGGDLRAIDAALAGITSGGSTDLHAGWDAGVRQLLQGSARALSRVILLSDGQANQGEIDPDIIAGRCAGFHARGVSTTTVGLGRGFNEELMLAMASAGGGQQYYGQTADDLFDGFDEELALLEAMVLRQLRIRLVPGPGVVVEPLGMVQPEGDGAIALSDLAWGAEAWLLVRLHVAAAAAGAASLAGTGGHGGRALLSAGLTAADLRGGTVAQQSQVLTLESVDLSAWNDLPQDALVAQRLQEIRFADEAAKVRASVLARDIDGARARLGRMEGAALDHPWLRDKLLHLRELVERDALLAAKELRYSMRKMSSRLSSIDEGRYRASETESASVPAYLRRKASEGTGRRRT